MTRDVITTRLLVHAMVREDGTVDTDGLYTVAGALGMTDQQVRLCLKRLVAEGRFTQQGRGRKASLRTTADITGAVAPEAGYVRYAYRQDRGDAGWDGTWHLVAFAIPESARAARDTLRDTILRLGAAAVQGGLYVTANPVTPLVEAAARRLGVLDSVTFLTSRDLRIGGQQDPAALAARLWPLDELAARYDRLAALAGAGLDRLAGTAALSGTDQLVLALELAAEFTRAMEPDPLLPPELLPQPWSGAHARHLAARCWTRLLEIRPPTGGEPRLFRLYADIVREAAPPS
ncbi:PaaX family transcriptional regulator C-terminal domain-containing protein [Couchioplanes azureus]|uniref:PaaX family transcriptional regulator C-terminal domain-containing protein n=1 Tax=Couchioplanes caeruleus TaxID=56438 RepID=UPI00166FC91A|nr:PaaX family transcriptional regulator C-terminal domain-containing protein [Couchioplanes caeruleus]GGQ60813.1 putative repressor in the phenylacetic acid catabolism [Couchioplanes caeruleus subsp. azureus]